MAISKRLFILFVFLNYLFCFNDVKAVETMKSKEYLEAREAYKLAKTKALTGDLQAMTDTFVIVYSTYPLLKESLQESVKFLIEAANQGEVAAQYNIGYLHQIGDVFEQNLETAQYWLLKAEKSGHKKSARQLGYLYLEKFYNSNSNSNVNIRKESQKWFLIGANNGDVTSMTQYGVGVFSFSQNEQEFLEAEKWLSIAVEKGDSSAMLYLAQYYELQFEDSNDENLHEKALSLYTSAANAGEKEAKKWIKNTKRD